MTCKFKFNDRVVWDPSTTKIPGGKGTVKGLASTELPVAGHQVIVEVDDYWILHEAGYDYSNIAIWEAQLSLEVKNPGLTDY